MYIIVANVLELQWLFLYDTAPGMKQLAYLFPHFHTSNFL